MGITTVLEKFARIGVAGLFVLSSAVAVYAAINRQILFTSAKFLGNATATSLAYNGTLAGTFEARNLKHCGLLCLGETTCDSFNFIKSTSTSLDDAGRCEVLANENAMCWYPWKFVERPNENAKFYINSLYTGASYFKLIPATTFGYDGATQFPWNTDCMDQGGTAGFVVAMRNNNTDSSSYTTDFKCRIFRHSFAMSQEAPVVVSYSMVESYNLRCPDGSVITAVEDTEANFYNPNTVRCQKPALPWAVNTTGCRVTDILRLPGNPNLSAMNDVGLTGTADSIWGVQCGTVTEIEALVAIELNEEYYNERFECCPLYIIA